MADRIDRPIPNSYWVIPGSFAAGEYPGAWSAEDAAAKLRTLLLAGVDCFIDLTEARDGLEPYAAIAASEAARLSKRVERTPRPIRDVSVPRSPQDMADTLDAIDDALAAGRTVYLHCWGGIGRTGTVVGCWLVRHGRSGEEALRQLDDWWQGVGQRVHHPCSPQTEEQFEYVLEWREPSGSGGRGG